MQPLLTIVCAKASRNRALKRITPKRKRVIAAFAAAPLGGAAVLTVIALAIGEWSGPSATGWLSIYVFAKIALVFFLLASILWYLVSIIFGILGYLLFRSRDWMHGRHWVLLFAIIGFVTGAAILFPLWISGPTVDANSSIAIIRTFVGCILAALVAGTATGLLFAWITKVEAPSADEVASTFE
jgi:hypothetical protein